MMNYIEEICLSEDRRSIVNYPSKPAKCKILVEIPVGKIEYTCQQTEMTKNIETLPTKSLKKYIHNVLMGEIDLQRGRLRKLKLGWDVIRILVKVRDFWKDGPDTYADDNW